MNKICTDIEQSKKLAEILPIESADMYYFLDPTPAGNIYHLTVQRVDVGIKNLPQYDEGDIPCWSLSALLGLMPKSIKGVTASDEEAGWPQYFYCPRLLLTDKEMWQCIYKEYNGAGASKCWTIGESPIDTCVEMILKLHELNLL